MRDVRRFAQPAEAVDACARQILQLLTAAINTNPNGLATLAVSGGSSPKTMFQLFARTPFPWSRVHLFWVDERGVPPADAQSNFRMTNEAWLSVMDPSMQFPAANIHRVYGELPAAQAAGKYSEDIRKYFALQTGQLPAFDVIHRGMGAEGHTASLFPGEPALADGPASTRETSARETSSKDIVAALWVEAVKQWRITMLPATLKAARHTVMLVVGADKAPVLERVFHAPYDPMQYPVQIATQEGAPAVWFVDDAAAASALPR